MYIWQVQIYMTVNWIETYSDMFQKKIEELFNGMSNESVVLMAF